MKHAPFVGVRVWASLFVFSTSLRSEEVHQNRLSGIIRGDHGGGNRFTLGNGAVVEGKKTSSGHRASSKCYRGVKHRLGQGVLVEVAWLFSRQTQGFGFHPLLRASKSLDQVHGLVYEMGLTLCVAKNLRDNDSEVPIEVPVP